jgi:RNA polymerase sigma-70 factor (ECF subfamily)
VTALERARDRAGDPDAASVGAAVRAVRGGDDDAFGIIVERYQRRVFGLALMMTRDPAAAADVTQEALVRAFEHLDSYDETRPFYPWLSTIAVRLAQNWLVSRPARERRTSVVLADAHAVTATGTDPLTALIADEHDRRLWEAVAALPSGQRTAVMLHYRQEMPVAEVAGALGVTGGTVKTLLFRARQRLRRTLGDALTERTVRDR